MVKEVWDDLRTQITKTCTVHFSADADRVFEMRLGNGMSEMEVLE